MAQDWFSDLTATPEKAPVAAGGGDWFSSLAQDTQSVPPAIQPDEPIIKDPSKAVGLKQRFVAGFASDEEETKRYYAKQLYPDEPVEQSVQRFGMRGNRMFHRADDGQLYEVVPRSIAGTIAEGAGGAIPALTGGTAAVVTAPLATTGVGGAVTIGSTYAAGAGGEYVRQKLGDVMMGEDVSAPSGVNWWNVAGEGLAAAAGQAGTGFAGNLAERAQVRDIGRLNQQTTQRAYDEAQKRGIEITPGQATGLKSLQAEEKRLNTRVPETMDEMNEFLREQSRKVEDAWYNELDKIAPQHDAEATGRAVRTAAEKALEDVTTARKRVAQPLYVKAMAEGKTVDVAPILSGIDAELQTVPNSGVMHSALSAARNVLTQAKATTKPSPLSGLPSVKSPGALAPTLVPRQPLSDLERLHNARVEIGNMIDTRSVPGPDGTPRPVNNIIIAKLTDVKNQLTAAMDKSSPLYAQARQTYSTVSGDVDDAFGSALARIAKLDDTSLLSTVREVFNPASRSPEMIEKLKTRLSAKDPAAWQDLKRLWLQDTVSDKLRTAQSGDVLNAAGKIVSALEDPATRRSLNAALDPAEKESLADLTWIFRRISNAKLGMGSDTAANAAADKEALKAATGIWARAARGVVSVLNPLGWDEAVGRVAEKSGERNMRRNAQSLVKLVTSGDRESLAAIKQLRQLTPRQWRALAASGQLGTRGLIAAPGVVNSATEDEQ